MSAVISLIQPLAAVALLAALIALADGKTALEIKEINTAADSCLKQIITRANVDPNAKFTYEFHNTPALRKVKFAAKDKSGTISVGDITAAACTPLNPGILTDAIKCAQEKFENALPGTSATKGVPYEPTFSEAYARTPCTFATVPEAALECLRSLANAAAIGAGFKGVNIPANTENDKLADYTPRFTPVYNSGKKWQKKFNIQIKDKPNSHEFTVVVSGVTAEQCPSLHYNDPTKIHNCMAETFKGSRGQLDNVKTKSYTYDELAAIFKTSSTTGAAVASCK